MYVLCNIITYVQYVCVYLQQKFMYIIWSVYCKHVSLLVQCPSLTAPINGTISCSGNTFGNTCTISCNVGYEFHGSATRSCQSDHTWSGIDAVCLAGTYVHCF